MAQVSVNQPASKFGTESSDSAGSCSDGLTESNHGTTEPRRYGDTELVRRFVLGVSEPLWLGSSGGGSGQAFFNDLAMHVRQAALDAVVVMGERS